jgi:hypothetical protein
MVWFFGQTPLALLKARRITGQTLTGKSAAHLNQEVFGRRIGLISRGKQLKTAGKLVRPIRSIMAGLVPAIHVFLARWKQKTWMPGTRPGMTSQTKVPDFVGCF